MQYLSATDLMNFLYCSRIIHFVHVLKRPQTATVKEYAGRRKSALFQDETRRRQLVKGMPHLRRQFGLYLKSAELGLHTVADCVLFDDRSQLAFPLEVKYGTAPRRLFRGQRYQVLMQALLLEKVTGFRSSCGYIRFLKDDKLVSIDTTHKHEVLDLFRNISHIISGECCPPPSPYKRRCVDCCYNSLCWGDVR